MTFYKPFTFKEVKQKFFGEKKFFLKKIKGGQVGKCWNLSKFGQNCHILAGSADSAGKICGRPLTTLVPYHPK